MASERQTYDAAYPSIRDVVSRPQDNLVIVSGDSRSKTYSAMAFQVTRTVRRVERVVDEITLADAEQRSWGYFGEGGFSRDTQSPGDEVFRIETDREKTIVEYGFGIPVDGVYVGVQTGDGSAVTGLNAGADRARGLDETDLNEHGSVLSDHTYIDAPTASTDATIPTTALSETGEHGLIRIDSKQEGNNNFYFAFDNQSGGQIDVSVIGKGQTYEVRPIKDSETTRQMLTGNGYNRRIINYGAFGNSNPNLPREWYDYEVTVGPEDLVPPQ